MFTIYVWVGVPECVLGLYVEVVVFPEPVGLVARVPEDDVAFLILLEVPWAHEDDVSFPYPSPFLHLASYPAHACLAVLALDVHACLAIVLCHYAEYVVLVGVHHPLAEVSLVLHQSLTQIETKSTQYYTWCLLNGRVPVNDRAIHGVMGRCGWAGRFSSALSLGRRHAAGFFAGYME